MAERDNQRRDRADDEDIFAGTEGLATAPAIRRVQVERLFGRYSYVIEPKIREAAGRPSRLVLLHGENGSGKTTILRLLWHLISPNEKVGHKSAIARVPFSSLVVDFTDDRQLKVTKAAGLQGAFTITASRRGEKSISADFKVDGNYDVGETPFYGNQITSEDLEKAVEEGSVAPEIGHAGVRVRRVIEFIEDLGIQPAFLGEDRGLQSDLEDADRIRRAGAELRSRGVVAPGQKSSDELELSIRKLSELVRSLTLSAQRSGSEEEAGIYERVLFGLAGSPIDARDQNAPDRSAESSIDELERLVPGFSEFGLMPPFDASKFRRLLEQVPGDRNAVAQSIMRPYLGSMRARIQALAEAERLIRLMITHSNRFLRDKTLRYPSPALGFRIETNEVAPMTLSPRQLSSGERQLLLLLCTTLLARKRGTLLLIDEPELSLGVPWQRKVLSSLVDCAEGTEVQLFVATHSIEMVTANVDSLVQLVNSGD
jgi:energy-coupling factor transporter ATP-binding protein EcfA2